MTADPERNLTWRSATLDDVPALARLNNAVTVHVGGHDLLSEAALAQGMAAARGSLAEDSLVAVLSDGVAVGWCGLPPPPEHGTRLSGYGGVHPDWRGRGIGRRLLAWQVERAGAHHVAAGATEAWALHVPTMDSDPGHARLLARFDFTPVRFWFEMVRDTQAPDVETSLAEGLSAVPYERRYEDSLYTAHAEAFADHWGFQQRSQRDWRSRVESVNFRPELSRLAVDGSGEVAGYVLTNGYQDPARMTMAVIGTRRVWRRRGVASALIARTLQAYRAAGVSGAELGVDTANPTGALGVYERMGFVRGLSSTTYGRAIG
jgi:GNAT superfamily N-acetyltransferase